MRHLASALMISSSSFGSNAQRAVNNDRLSTVSCLQVAPKAAPCKSANEVNDVSGTGSFQLAETAACSSSTSIALHLLSRRKRVSSHVSSSS